MRPWVQPRLARVQYDDACAEASAACTFRFPVGPSQSIELWVPNAVPEDAEVEYDLTFHTVLGAGKQSTVVHFTLSMFQVRTQAACLAGAADPLHPPGAPAGSIL